MSALLVDVTRNSRHALQQIPRHRFHRGQNWDKMTKTSLSNNGVLEARPGNERRYTLEPEIEGCGSGDRDGCCRGHHCCPDPSAGRTEAPKA